LSSDDAPRRDQSGDIQRGPLVSDTTTKDSMASSHRPRTFVLEFPGSRAEGGYARVLGCLLGAADDHVRPTLRRDPLQDRLAAGSLAATGELLRLIS